jgi:hypothetical protein
MKRIGKTSLRSSPLHCRAPANSLARLRRFPVLGRLQEPARFPNDAHGAPYTALDAPRYLERCRHRVVPVIVPGT